MNHGLWNCLVFRAQTEIVYTVNFRVGKMKIEHEIREISNPSRLSACVNLSFRPSLNSIYSNLIEETYK